MGTRAIITKNNKPFIATHWDGYPGSLGKELLNAKTDEDIIKVAEDHTIDFADKSILPILNKKRFIIISDRTQEGNGKKYTPEEIEELYNKGMQINFSVMSAGDYPIDDIEGYNDWAEYQYDLTDGLWRFKSCNGLWGNSEHKDEGFKKLNKVNCKKE